MTISDIASRLSSGTGDSVEPKLKSALLSSRQSERILEAATRIGQRLVDSASWDGSRCSWIVSTNDRSDPWARKRVQEVAGCELYQGVTGIALFLAELGARIGDSQFQRVAEGALRHAEHSLTSQRPDYSFHSGVSGLAYVLGRCAQLFGQEVFAERALSVLKPLRGIEHEMRGTDVIGGPAGVIPVLLLLAEPLDEPALEECAIHLGIHLIRTRRQWPMGSSWPSVGASAFRDLNGLAHGAAGVGAAFVELYGVTGESGFQFAAEQAFAYEQESFDAALGNWPDFRNATLSEAISNADRREALKLAMSRGGKPPYYTLHFMNAWCHGAAGIGLTRLRAYELLGSLTYRAEAEQAVEATARHASIVHNYSLCHGMFGNDETLIAGSRILGNPSWEQSAVQRALESIEQYEFSGAGWPSGTIGSGPDPSLMLGDAGIGYYLLRLAHTDTPSIVLPVVQRNQPRSTATTSSRPAVPEIALRQSAWGWYFGRTQRVLRRLCPRIADKVEETVASLDPLDLRVVKHVLDAALRAESETIRDLLDDALRLEQRRFQFFCDPPDFCEGVIQDLRRIPLATLDWSAVLFSLPASMALVTEDHEWDAWLESANAPAAPAESAKGITYLVRLSQGNATTRRLAPVAAVVLSACQVPRTFEAAIEAVLSETDGISKQEVRPLVRDQIARWYNEGVLIADPITQRHA